MNLTRLQLFKAVKKNDYIAARWGDGDVIGINCKIGLIGLKNIPLDNTETNVIGFYPISFHEYIRIKVPIIKA